MTTWIAIVAVVAALISVAVVRDGYRRVCPRCKRWRGLREISRRAAPPTGPVDTVFVRYCCRRCGTGVTREEAIDEDGDNG